MDTGQAALVTGGSRGIGQGICTALGERGWRVAVNYRSDETAAHETVAEIEKMGAQAFAVQADVAVKAERQKLLDTVRTRWDRLDLLVNNAGMAPRQRSDLLEMTEASYDEVMGTNLKGPFFLTQAAARWMVELMHSGRIERAAVINIGSLSAYTSSTNRGEYCISKAGLAMMTALFADRLAGDGILVYELRPGIVATDMTAVVQGKYDRLIQQGLLPIQRWGQPEDVGRAVVALAEGWLPYSTGEVINIDGGFHIRRL